MKLDSESPYHHTHPSHGHDTKVIVHNENPFILAKDNHFMINMLNIDKEALKEGNHGFTSPIERKSSKVASPPKQYLNMEDSINRNKTNDEYMEALYSAPACGFEMVIKEDFYTDKIVTKVEFPETRICNENDPCHVIKDITVDKQVQSSDKSLVEEEPGPMESSVSNQTRDNGHNDLTSEMAGSSSADDLKYSVFDSPITIIDQDQAHPASILHNSFDGIAFCLGYCDSGDKLDTTASVVSNTSAKVTENPADLASFFQNDSDGKGSSVISNTHAKVTGNLAFQASFFHNDSDGKGSSVSSIDSEGYLDTTELGVSNVSADVTESPAIPVFDVHNDCDGKGYSVSSIDYEGKVDTAESVVQNTSSEVIENQLPPPQEKTTDLLQVDLSSQSLRNDQKPSVDEQKFQAISEESNSASTASSFASEVSVLSNGSKEILANRKLPSGVITFSFDTEEASTSGRDVNEGTTNIQKSEVAQNSPQTEEAMVDGASASARCSFIHLIQEESNLSGPALLSGPIANSGHIPYSGSISLRSDSSTTSARSFAFPILQSEWNSSPVKMTKADRRNLRKHRGWRMGILCCRF